MNRMHVKGDKYKIALYDMVHRYVQNNRHRLTIIRVFLYGQMFIFIVSLGSNGFCDRHNHS